MTCTKATYPAILTAITPNTVDVIETTAAGAYNPPGSSNLEYSCTIGFPLFDFFTTPANYCVFLKIKDAGAGTLTYTALTPTITAYTGATTSTGGTTVAFVLA